MHIFILLKTSWFSTPNSRIILHSIASSARATFFRPLTPKCAQRAVLHLNCHIKGRFDSLSAQLGIFFKPKFVAGSKKRFQFSPESRIGVETENEVKRAMCKEVSVLNMHSAMGSVGRTRREAPFKLKYRKIMQSAEKSSFVTAIRGRRPR